MRILLLVSVASVTVPVLAATPLLQPGDVVLTSNLSVQCEITPPAPVFDVSVIPKDGTVSDYSYAPSWRSYTNPGAVAYSNGIGMIVSIDQTGLGDCLLSVLHDDGSMPAFGAGIRDINGIAPTSTDVLVLAGGEL